MIGVSRVHLAVTNLRVQKGQDLEKLKDSIEETTDLPLYAIHYRMHEQWGKVVLAQKRKSPTLSVLEFVKLHRLTEIKISIL